MGWLFYSVVTRLTLWLAGHFLKMCIASTGIRFSENKPKVKPFFTNNEKSLIVNR